MKKWLFLALVPFLFSGCGSIMTYNSNLIGLEQNKFLAKVSSVDVNIKKYNNSIEKKIENRLASINIDTGNISNEITKVYFSQYFINNNIVDSINNKGIFIDFNVLDYSFSSGLINGTELYIKCKIIFYKDGIEILNKLYEVKNTSKVIFTISPFRTPKDDQIELFHKMVLDIFENQIKPDILNAL